MKTLFVGLSCVIRLSVMVDFLYCGALCCIMMFCCCFSCWRRSSLHTRWGLTRLGSKALYCGRVERVLWGVDVLDEIISFFLNNSFITAGNPKTAQFLLHCVWVTTKFDLFSTRSICPAQQASLNTCWKSRVFATFALTPLHYGNFSRLQTGFRHVL